MSRYHILSFLCFLAVVMLVAGGPAPDGSHPSIPNIIVILSDDMGYSALGCYGSEIETPDLDRLAANGLKSIIREGEGKAGSAGS